MDNIERELKKYEAQEQIVSGESELDEDKLKRELEIRKSMMHHMQAMADMYGRQASKAASKPKNGAQASSLRSLKRGMDSQADSIHSEIVKIEKKLEKLHRFLAGTQGLFENSLQDLKSAITGVTKLSDNVNMSNSGSLTGITFTDREKDLAQGMLVDGMLAGSEKLFEKGAKTLNDTSNYLSSLALTTYGMEVGKTGSVMAKVGKTGPLLGAGLVFASDWGKSKDVGQAITHTVVSTVTGLLIDGFGTFFSVGIGFSVALGANAVVQTIVIDKTFEQYPTRKWQGMITDAFRTRAQLNDQFVTNNKNLTNGDKKYLEKYAGDPMTISNNFKSHVSNNFGVQYGRN